MHINELKAKSPQQLLKMAEDMGIENPAQLNVQQLRFAVMRVFAADKKVTLANIGAGVEFVVANGVQVGVDYRYQYNSALQLHNIKVSGSYRF